MVRRYQLYVLVGLFFWSGISAVADSFSTPRLRLHSYEALGFPPQLSKADVEWMIQTSSDELLGTSFVDLGAMSDFMHMHILFRPLSPLQPPQLQLSHPDVDVDWSQLEQQASLIHTQEYPFLREGRGYIWNGRELDRHLRNWILWLSDFPWAGRGEFSQAYLFSRFHEDPERRTISSDHLLAEYFGEDQGEWEYSLYFFRTRCEALEQLNISQEELEGSNILRISQPSGPVCLVLVSFYCRQSYNQRFCREGVELPSYY